MNPTLSLVLALVLATMFWTVVAALLRTGRHRTYTIGPVIVLWCLHVAAFWTVSAVRKLFFGYVGPSSTMTYWSIIIYVQAGLSILGMLILARQQHQ